MTSTNTTKETQYEVLVALKKGKGLTKLGMMNNQVWHDDPRRLVFTLSRYKFVAKLLVGKQSALEVGCGDAFASRIVKQEVKNLTVLDFDPIFVADIQDRADSRWPRRSAVHDMLSGPYPGTFDAIYSLDVLEHIDQSNELRFVENIIRSLSASGVLIVGMPSLESQTYASVQSKLSHVNCKTGKDLQDMFEHYFHNVFLFSMNDEVVHTGFTPMAHYLIVVCTTPKSTTRVGTE
jgi:2-polyprenyl-3-methyl-5-hydroxy-6-metoxy-1,4-benzoquinol methylase